MSSRPCSEAHWQALRARDIHDICDSLVEEGVPLDAIAPIREFAESLLSENTSATTSGSAAPEDLRGRP